MKEDPRASQLEVLNEIARIATLDLELRPMLQRITDALANRFDWQFVALVAVDAPRAAFVCEAVTSTLPTEIEIGYSRALGSGVVGMVAQTEQPVVIDDVSTWPGYVETMPNARSEICVPIKHKGQLTAILNLESTRVAAFHGQLPLLITVADQIAGAIAAARMYERVMEVTAQLEQKTRDLEEANEHLSKAIETLHRISAQDGLTGVSNRRTFDETLALEWRRAMRTRTPISLLLVDIDHFKNYNDTHGHQAGDECLRRVAQTLRNSVHRAADLVARYGGEEFVVLLPDTPVEHARQIAESIRAAVEKLGATVSIGVASELSSIEALIRKADEALYEAKRLGRNQVV